MTLDKNTNLTNAQIIESAKLTGAIAAAAISGPDDGDSVFAGGQVARNAAENNYLLPLEKAALVKELSNCGNDQSCKTQVQGKYEAISAPRDKEFSTNAIKCTFGSCSDYDKLNEELRFKITDQGDEYYQGHSQEFVLLPPEKSIYHNYRVNSDGNVLIMESVDYQKYIHPIMGYEVVLDNSRNIVKDPINRGTYNFYNPNIEGISNNLIASDSKHVIADVLPYYMSGNSASDKSSIFDRATRHIWTSPQYQISVLPIINLMSHIK